MSFSTEPAHPVRAFYWLTELYLTIFEKFKTFNVQLFPVNMIRPEQHLFFSPLVTSRCFHTSPAGQNIPQVLDHLVFTVQGNISMRWFFLEGLIPMPSDAAEFLLIWQTTDNTHVFADDGAF